MKTDVWVVEYSAEQRCFHIDQLSRSLAANRRALEEGRNPGYIPIYIALSSEEAHALAERWKREHPENSEGAAKAAPVVELDWTSIFYRMGGAIAMTNEELVLEIQSGQRERWVELWRQVQGLAWQYIHKWSWAKEKAGVEREDLLQASMLALWMAADSYDAARGAQFSTWFVTAMQGEFTQAAGIRTGKQSQDPLRDAMSLDAPLRDNEGDSLALADTLEDPQAEEPFRQAELRVSLKKAPAELPADQRRALYRRYWLEVPADPKAHNAALRALRHPSRSRALRGLL